MHTKYGHRRHASSEVLLYCTHDEWVIFSSNFVCANNFHHVLSTKANPQCPYPHIPLSVTTYNYPICVRFRVPGKLCSYNANFGFRSISKISEQWKLSFSWILKRQLFPRFCVIIFKSNSQLYYRTVISSYSTNVAMSLYRSRLSFSITPFQCFEQSSTCARTHDTNHKMGIEWCHTF